VEDAPGRDVRGHLHHVGQHRKVAAKEGETSKTSGRRATKSDEANISSRKIFFMKSSRKNVGRGRGEAL
jgi:hypothetical protein